MKTIGTVTGVIIGILAGFFGARMEGLNWHSVLASPGAANYQNSPVKRDPAFVAEWEKLKKTNPQEFANQKARFLVMAQIDLARFGYGTRITGTLDQPTQEALKAYQLHKGIAATGDIEPVTIDNLSSDDDSISHPDLFLGPYVFIADGWDGGTFTATGSWVEEGGKEPDLENSQLDCYEDWHVCIDAQAREMKLFSATSIIGKSDAYRIKTWDKYEIVADSGNFDPCERDTLHINRQEKSVSLVSVPAYKDEKTCKIFGAPKTVTFRLVDGKQIADPRNKARQSAFKSVIQMSEKAWAIIDGK